MFFRPGVLPSVVYLQKVSLCDWETPAFEVGKRLSNQYEHTMYVFRTKSISYESLI